MGKTTSTKHLAWAWAAGEDADLQKFSYVFHVALGHIKAKRPLGEIVKEEHFGKDGIVSKENVEDILKGKAGGRVLVILDGYDELDRDKCPDIDLVLRREILTDCAVIVTSRESDKIQPIRDFFVDAELEMRGFDKNGITEYLRKNFSAEETVENLLKQAFENGIIQDPENDLGILTIPLFLNMFCSICQGPRSKKKVNVTSPAGSKELKSKSALFDALVKNNIERKALKTPDSGGEGSDRQQEVMCLLWKLAWEGLNHSGGIQQYFTQVKLRLVSKLFLLSDDTQHF